MLRRKGSLAFLALLAAPLAFAQAPAPAPTADEIVAKYVKTDRRDGEDRGRQDAQAHRQIHRAAAASRRRCSSRTSAPTWSRQEFTFQGMTGVTAYDGKTGWKIEPWQGKKDPGAARRRRAEGHRRGLGLRRPARPLQGEGQHARVRRQRAGRGHRRLEAQADPEERRRPVLLHGHRLLRPDQDRVQAHDPRRRAGVRGHARRLQGGRRLVPAPLDRAGPQGQPEQVEGRLPTDRSERADGRRRSSSSPRRRRWRSEGRDESRTLAGRISRGNPRRRPGGARGGTRGAGQGRLRDDLRPRRAQHRLGDDERPRRGDRRRARGLAPDGLHRRGLGRRLEVGQRRHDVQAGLRQAARAVDRRRDDRSEEPEDRLGRHRRILDAQQRLDRRRRLQVRRRRRQLDERGPRRHRAHREDPRRSLEDRHGLRLRAGQALVRQRRPRRLQDDRRRQDVDEGPEGRQPLDRLLDDLHGPAEPEHALRRHVGLPPQGLDVPLGRRQPRRRRARAACSSRPTAARRGRTSTRRARRACRPSPGAASRSPWRPAKPNVVYAFIEAAIPKNGLYRSDDGGATWQAMDRSQFDGLAAVLLRQPDRGSEGREQALQAGPDRSSPRPTAARASRPSAAERTATSTTSGSIPTTPTT